MGPEDAGVVSCRANRGADREQAHGTWRAHCNWKAPLKKEVVWSVLANPFHCGKFRYNGELGDGKHKQHAFWSEEDYEEMLRIHERWLDRH